MWDLRRIKWHVDRFFFSSASVFPSYFTNAVCCLHLNTAFVRRISGRRLGSFKQNSATPSPHWTGRYFDTVVQFSHNREMKYTAGLLLVSRNSNDQCSVCMWHVTEVISQEQHVREKSGSCIFCLPDSRLQVGVHPAVPTTGHLDTVNTEMVPKSTALLRACDAALPA
jgi:hypothetical protein